MPKIPIGLKRALMVAAAVALIALASLIVYGMIVKQTFQILAFVKVLTCCYGLLLLHERWVAHKSS